MKNALIITTISGFVPQFEQNHLKILQNMGYKIHYASNFRNPHYGSNNHRLEGTGIICHQVDFVRSPFRILENLQAYRQLKKLFQEIPFALVHCHTPMGGVLGRLAARHIPQICIIYTAHGFHFFHGAPWRNWIFYYPVERWLAHYTNTLITINREDYLLAQKFSLRCGGRVYRVNGVGISLFPSLESKKFLKKESNREVIRKALGILPEEYVFLSVGELSRRKNHQVVIRALKELKKRCDISCIRYVICGEGKEKDALNRLIQKNQLEQQIVLMGYQENVQIFLQAADCFILPSLQEGLPVALLEAMREGLPIIASKIRGSRELVEGEAFLVAANKEMQYAEAMQKVMRINRKRKTYSRLEYYSEPYVTEQMRRIYRESLKNT